MVETFSNPNVSAVIEAQTQDPDPIPEENIPKSITKTKTIRFSGDDMILWDAWDKDMVQKIKDFMKTQLTFIQTSKYNIQNAENPKTHKKELLREKMDLIKFLTKKEVSQETLDRHWNEYSDLLGLEL